MCVVLHDTACVQPLPAPPPLSLPAAGRNCKSQPSHSCTITTPNQFNKHTNNRQHNTDAERVQLEGIKQGDLRALEAARRAGTALLLRFKLDIAPELLQGAEGAALRRAVGPGEGAIEVPRSADVAQVKRLFGYQAGGRLPAAMLQLFTSAGERMRESGPGGAPAPISAYGVGDGDSVTLRVVVPDGGGGADGADGDGGADGAGGGVVEALALVEAAAPTADFEQSRALVVRALWRAHCVLEGCWVWLGVCKRAPSSALFCPLSRHSPAPPPPKRTKRAAEILNAAPRPQPARAQGALDAGADRGLGGRRRAPRPRRVALDHAGERGEREWGECCVCCCCCC